MIIGAGLAGTIAAFVFPKEEVYESRDRSWVEHQAVLRFRSPAVSDLTGIPFRRVTVRKGIWLHGRWTEPTITACNMYSLKTTGRLMDRSIWDIFTVDRFVAPPDLRERMCDALGPRIHWETPVDFSSLGHESVISTVPMPAMTPLLKLEPLPFRYAAITTLRLSVPGADIFQTVYFPDQFISLYRASFTGDSLICEFASNDLSETDVAEAANQVAAAFAMPEIEGELIRAARTALHTQAFGKISPINEDDRRRIVLELTRQKNIYSLGRFATWRNILLDDVVHDAAVIKRLLNHADDYDRALGKERK